MGLSVILIHEMHVVGGHSLYIVSLRDVEEHLVDLCLLLVDLLVGVLLEGLVALELQIIVVAKHLLIP